METSLAAAVDERVVIVIPRRLFGTCYSKPVVGPGSFALVRVR
jgi:hypothetical protein